MAFSTILTNANTVQLQFKDQIQLKQQAVNENLKTFINFLHKNSIVVNVQDEYFAVSSSTGIQYRFYNYGSHFMRLTLITGVKKWYKVS